MNRAERFNSSENQESWVSSKCFARYAEADLDRWRQLVGHRVRHVDSRWGIGMIEAVSWGSPCDHVSAYVQVSISYEAGWTVVVHSETWPEHHESVSIPPCVETVIGQCLDEALSEDEQSDCLAKHSRELREQHDHEALKRLAKKRQLGA